MILIGILVVLLCQCHFARADDAAKVKVELYIETLCPYCSKLMHTEIRDLLDEGLFDIADVSVVPSGNAHMASDQSISCQHGEQECYWNRMLACVIDSSKDQTTFLQYATCSEGTPPSDIAKQAKPCLEELGMSFDDIEACANGDVGAELAAAAFQRTAALQPPHEYVPWVVVNGQPLRGDYGHLRRYICATYTGPKPEACYRERGPWREARGSLSTASPGVSMMDGPLRGEQGRPGVRGTRGLPGTDRIVSVS